LPGPLPLPFIECSYMFMSDTKEQFALLQQKYGDFCEMYLNGVRNIVISRPEYLETMLTASSKDPTFLLRLPYTEALEEFGMAGKGIIANHDVNSWKFNRHFFNQAILSPSFNHEIVEWADKLFPEFDNYLKSLANLSLSGDNLQDNNNWSLEIDLATWIRRFTNDMFVVLITGERSYSMASYYNTLSPIKVSRSDTLIEDSEKFIQSVGDHLMGLTFFIYLGSFYRHYVPPYKYQVKALLDNRDYLFDLIDNMIKKRRKEIEETPIGTKLRHDMLTSLITANTERDINNAKKVEGDMFRPMSDIEIRGNLLDAFLGGTDTISSTFSFICYYLCLNPQVKQKMVAEIDSIFPPNIPFNMKYNDLLKLKYCDAVIKESSRIRPVGNEFPRYVEYPCEVGGYHWDENIVFHINMNGIHWHKDHWSNPEIFDPERFYEKDYKERHKFALITFGAGLRNCPGKKLAMVEILSLLVLLFRKYDIELVDINAPLKVKSTIVNLVEELNVRIWPRN
ncbi:267_t:CDS:2, partial [Cetraspora pellucida]